MRQVGIEPIQIKVSPVLYSLVTSALPETVSTFDNTLDLTARSPPSLANGLEDGSVHIYYTIFGVFCQAQIFLKNVCVMAGTEFTMRRSKTAIYEVSVEWYMR